MFLELLIGPMFSGKSSLLQARLRRYQTLKWSTLVLTSSLDKRYTSQDEGSAAVVTHDGQTVPATAVSKLLPVLKTESYRKAKAILVEEAQFFDDLLEFVLHAVEIDGKDVVVVGLDGDRNRCNFGRVLDLIPYADCLTKLTALCSRCCDGTPGLFSCLVVGERHDREYDQIRVGGSDSYEPMCRRHYLEQRRKLDPIVA